MREGVWREGKIGGEMRRGEGELIRMEGRV